MKKEVLNVKDGTMSESNEKALVEFLSLKRRNYEILQRESSGKFGREEKKDRMRVCDQLCKLNHDDKKQKTTLQYTSTNLQAARQPVKDVAEGTGYGDLNPRVKNEAMNFESKPLSKSIWRNHRRSWTPELHERFVEALEYLGGPQVAKPKQTRDAMKVEGLTNDQVKSHLQVIEDNLSIGLAAEELHQPVQILWRKVWRSFRTHAYQGSIMVILKLKPNPGWASDIPHE
ncbi:unnamed protein product [Dovyalis caffra]|uniref:HTH myb-type domain-containing protein n=1 Tax=Dovyalis caffra TaxID=77055 RepID=A0AAV1REW1_9ROSI|nr:unnamed protein product [Dovyalis caffra]